MNIKHIDIKSDNYFTTIHPKSQIYLHHTVSSTAKSVISWWDQDGNSVATAFVIDKDGTIIQTFDPKYWSFHLGLSYGPSKGFADKKSIGIEIVNEGGLVKKDEVFYWNGGKSKYSGKVTTLEKSWRGFNYFANYTDEQFKSVVELIDYLTKLFNIPRKLLGNLEYNKSNALDFIGILAHCNVRSDKSDISPAFPLNKLGE